jgi:hypothetical protein
MSSRPTPASRRHDATAHVRVKNVFAREPLLIPPRPRDRPRPWFRRRAVWVSLVVAIAVVLIVVEYGARIARVLPDVIGR